MKTRGVFKSGFYGLLAVALTLLAVFQILGIILYIVFRYSNPHNFQPFEMATVSGLIGGFALAGGFSANERLRVLVFSLRKIGAIFISATIAFSLFGIFIPLTDQSFPSSLTGLSGLISLIAVYLGAFLFTIGTIWFLCIIPRLFRDN